MGRKREVKVLRWTEIHHNHKPQMKKKQMESHLFTTEEVV